MNDFLHELFYGQSGRKGVAVFGAGSQMREAVVKLVGTFDISINCIYDTNAKHWGGAYYGVPIKKYDPDDDYYVVLADPEGGWKKVVSYLPGIFIRDWCLSMLVVENILSYTDAYEIYKLTGKKADIQRLAEIKKILTLYGNCQCFFYTRLLNMSEEFNRSFFIVSLPQIQNIHRHGEEFIKNFIGDTAFYDSISAFIYQVIGDNYGTELNSTVVLSKLQRNCLKIHVSAYHFTGYFVGKRPFDPKPCMSEYLSDDFNVFHYRDGFIESLFSNGESVDSIYSTLSDENFVTQENIQKGCDLSIERMSDFESRCDIHVMDYIRDNYSKKQLFYQPRHMSSELGIIIVNKMLIMLGMPEIPWTASSVLYIASNQDDSSIPLYPCVIKSLDLKHYYRIVTQLYKYGTTEAHIRVSFRDYVYNYVHLMRNSLICNNQIQKDSYSSSCN